MKIIAPDLKKKFSGCGIQGSVNDTEGDSEIEGDDCDSNNVQEVLNSVSETEGRHGADGEDGELQDPMEDDEATQADSLGVKIHIKYL
ncbi:hypothetical protein SAY87_011173 [Trapa incisa]|nr:hypothetical protein SAY87_011173 [Trapa incisa]